MNLNEIEDGSVDAGLLMLSMVTKEGQTRTHKEIADACGVSDQTISNIEKAALYKIRRKMQALGINEVGEILNLFEENKLRAMV